MKRIKEPLDTLSDLVEQLELHVDRVSAHGALIRIEEIAESLESETAGLRERVTELEQEVEALVRQSSKRGRDSINLSVENYKLEQEKEVLYSAIRALTKQGGEA